MQKKRPFFIFPWGIFAWIVALKNYSLECKRWQRIKKSSCAIWLRERQRSRRGKKIVSKAWEVCCGTKISMSIHGFTYYLLPRIVRSCYKVIFHASKAERRFKNGERKKEIPRGTWPIDQPPHHHHHHHRLSHSLSCHPCVIADCVL